MKSITKIASAKPSVLFPVISPEFVLCIHRLKRIERMSERSAVDYARLGYLNAWVEGHDVIILGLEIL